MVFFFQAEDGIRDLTVTGVQTCALPISMRGGRVVERVELATDAGGVAQKDADVLEAAVQQFYEDRVAPAEIDLPRSEEHTSELQSQSNLVCRLLLEKKKKKKKKKSTENK